MKNLNYFILIFFFILESSLNAAPLDISKNSKTLLKDVGIFLDANELNISQIQKSNTFYNTQKNVNFGFVKDKALWVKLSFYNPLDKNITKILQVRNPLLEDVYLYDNGDTKHTGSLQKSAKELHHSFSLTLKPHEIKTFYLKVKNTTTTLRLTLSLKDPKQFFQDECYEKRIIFIFFTILFMLMAYNFLLYFYSKERAYFYYSLYLLTLLFQQSTYLGITQIYFPHWFVYYDNLSVVLKVNLMYITAIIFARSFLQTQRYPIIDKIYKLLLLLGVVEIPLLGAPWFYIPEIAIFTGLVFVFYNMYASIYIYKRGYKQARFFVIGWGFQLIGFTFMILDGVGLISVMDKVPDLVMFFTSIEAVLLSLAFVDRYNILQNEKQKSDMQLMQEMQNRQKIIEKEIVKATKELSISLENEKNLLKELHHRTKNNLQLILSLVRMQTDQIAKNARTPFILLEGRINAIAKAQELLYIDNNFEVVQMHEYVYELCNNLESLSEKSLLCHCNISSLVMPLKEASYLGLIVNELITNSVKYVNKDEIVIEIKIYKETGNYVFFYSDNGEGFKKGHSDSQTLGLQLIKVLVEDQLDGELEIESEGRLQYIIRFSL